MELMAVIVALEKLKKHQTEFTIYTDPKYVCNSGEKKWVLDWEKKGFKGKKNADLWRKFLILYRRHKVSFQWVKGHSTNEFNNRADELAVAAANSSDLAIDTEFEKLNEENGLF